MANYDANIDIILNAQKAFQELDALQKKIEGLSTPKAKIRQAVLSETSQDIGKAKTEVKAQVRAGEQKLQNQIRLNAAIARQETLLQSLKRAGVEGGRQDRVDDLVKISEKFPKKLGIQNAVNSALEKELQTQREINRTNRAQNATSSKILTSVKKRIQRLKAVGATEAEIDKLEKKRGKLIERNDRKQTDLARETFSQLDRGLSSLERKYSTFLSKPSKQLSSLLSSGPARTILGTPQALKQKTDYYERIAKSVKPLSSPMRPQSVLGSDSALRKKAEYYERIAKAAKTTSAPRSPIRGSKTLEGSPIFKENEAKRLNRQENLINKTLDDQRKLRERNANAAKRTADQVARKAKQERLDARKAQGASIVGGAFPLLFGGGPGSIIGGALGGAIGGKELGFELSIGLSAVGSVIDRLVGSARNLGDAFSSVDGTLNQVKQVGFNVNTATEKRVQLLLEEGRATEAFLLILQRTGIRPEQVNNLRKLDGAFDELQDATAELFVTVISELVPAITVVTNLVTDFVKALTGPEIQRAAANLDPQAFQAAKTQAATEISPFGVLGDDQAYEKRLTELSREIIAANTNTPEIDTSQLEKVNTFRKENVALIEKQAAALGAGNDFAEEAAYIAARQIVFARTRLEVSEAQGNRDKVAIALARESLSLEELKVKRKKDIDEALKKQIKAEASIKRSEFAANNQLFDLQVKEVELKAGKVAAIEKERELVRQVVQGEVELLQIERQEVLEKNKGLGLEARINALFDRKILLAEEGGRLIGKELQIRSQLLQLEQEITRERELQNVRRGLEQEVRDTELQTFDGLSPFATLDRQQSSRRDRIFGDLDLDEREVQKALKIKPDDEGLQNELAGIQERREAYEKLLPVIEANQKQQLLYNQALNAVQGPVNSLVSGLTDVVTGTKTAEEAFADFLKSVADQLLKTAATLIAQYIAIGIARAFAGLAGGESATLQTGPGKGLTSSFTEVDAGVLGSLGFAEGGYVSGPTRALVGEGGESEYIIPESKMRESMARYSRGARGGAVIPETGESGTSGEGGGTAVAAPIDVRFNVERINNVDYVTAEEFQLGLQRAAQQGASEGERRTLRSLKYSSATRRGVGF